MPSMLRLIPMSEREGARHFSALRLTGPSGEASFSDMGGR
jgi:hypothetical protein